MDFDTAFARWCNVPPDSITHHVTGAVIPADQEFEVPSLDPAVQRFHSIISARQADPLIAALDTVHNTVQIRPHQQATAIAAFRTTFPPTCTTETIR